LALDAEVELTNSGNRKWIPLEKFFTGVNQTQRQPNELLTSIRWPIPAKRTKGAFYKVGLRKADAISVLSVAVWVALDEKGKCKTVRIALGAVSPRPLRAYEAEDLFPGNSPGPNLIEEAAQLCTKAASPIDDIRGSSDYRRRITGVIVRRLLNDVITDLLK
jgi:carbon-monoxide dehydrogenase medium subunit